ncbi:polysaccharide biosynthesis protein [Gloeothece citriformis PCC 7424]|uniref:Polysaccharide biosynthesis protein n=1 Tax=Gloeothece citriformis (strain PCC 7424) TaxID=65393 RepID=B7KLJ9_GLOC7|nr:lipopolysaccharide biosynthesis protein [Gloeothece citriformis]ACK72571.1 polysaccharide biosynthesis protein [Gloeothece citriformis PCC 7424]
MSIKQKALKGIVWSVIQQWGGQAISLIIFLVLARLLTPEAFGLLSLANLFLAFMQIFLEQGFSQALIQRKDLEPEHLDSAFWTHLVSGIFLTIIGVAISGLVAEIFSQSKLIPILQCFSFLFFINSLGHVPQAILTRNMAFKIMAVRILVAIVISGIVGVVMALNGFGVWSLVSQQFVFQSVVVLVVWGTVNWRPRFRFSQKHFQDLLNFSIHVLAFKFLKFFHKRSDSLLIGYFLGEVALGYYAIAYRVLEVMTQLLVGTCNQVALPTFARLQTEPKLFRQAFYKATQFTSVIAIPTFAGMAALTPELVKLLFGEKWLPSVPIMQILAFVGILYSLLNFNWSAFIAMGKPSWRFWLTLLTATLNIVACLLAVRWGIVAVALGYLMSDYLAFPVCLWALNKLIKVSLVNYLQQFVTPVIGSIVMVTGILIVKYFLANLMNTPALLLVGTVSGALIYGGFIRFLNPKLFWYLLDLVSLTLSKPKKQSS